VIAASSSREEHAAPVLVHALDGRARFRVPRVKRDVEYVERLSCGLSRENGIRTVRVNIAAASLIVTYDSQTLSFEMLLTLVVTPPARASSSPLPVQRKRRTLLGPVMTGALGLALALCGASVPLTASCLVLTTAPVAASAVRALVRGRLSVDALDTLAIVVLALRGSLGAASLSAFLIATGEAIRALTARRSQAALANLFGTYGQLAWVLRGDHTERVPAEALVSGETVVVYPGELILADGVVISGDGTVDQKSLTGESKPVPRRLGDEVFASTVLSEGKLHVRVERAGAQTRASRIVQLLAGAPVHETAIANYAGRFADRFVLPVLLTGCAIFALTRDPVRAAAVIVFDFATGVRVAVPTTVLAAMSAAVRRHILIKGGRALEKLARVDTIVFDKTGTLTEGVPHVVDVAAIDGKENPDEILALAAGAELRLTHPAAHAIVDGAQSRGLAVIEAQDSDYAIGLGVCAWVNGDRVVVGSEQHLLRVGISVPPGAREAAAQAGARGASTVFVARRGAVIGWITYADIARVEAREVIGLLRAYGVGDLTMVTGDQPDVAAAVAATLGLEHVDAEVFPEGKAEIVQALQRRGRTVAVVGDGINDSPALAYADVAISLKDGSDAARETADVVLHGDLRGLTEAIDIARHAMRTIHQDLAIVGVPNALGFVLAAFGIISPTIATALNNGSAVAAALNGLRPLSYRPGGERGMRLLEQPAWTNRLTAPQGMWTRAAIASPQAEAAASR
jgi:P-type Cu2+ transporter